MFDKSSKKILSTLNDSSISETSHPNWNDSAVGVKTVLGGHNIPVSDIRLYNRLFSQEEINEIYFGGTQLLNH